MMIVSCVLMVEVCHLNDSSLYELHVSHDTSLYSLNLNPKKTCYAVTTVRRPIILNAIYLHWMRSRLDFGNVKSVPQLSTLGSSSVERVRRV